MLKVVFYRSLYTIIRLFIQFFIWQTNYRSAQFILCCNIFISTKYRRQLKVQFFDQFNEGKLFSNHITSSVKLSNEIPFNEHDLEKYEKKKTNKRISNI